MNERAVAQLLGALREYNYGFVTVSPATHARVNARPENREARGLADVLGWSRPFRAEVIPAPIFGLMREAEVAVPEAGGLWRSAIRVSSLGGALLAHSAYPTLGADAVFFGPDTYRFVRAVEAGLRGLGREVRRAVDIGCGAGPGAIAVARAVPGAEVVMVDINEAALGFARANAAAAGATRAVACRSDLLSEVAGSFDLIVSNPPYLNDPLHRAYRHGGGPLGGDLSLRILDAALERLSSPGMLILYTGAAIVDGRDPLRAEISARLAAIDASWSYEEVDPDVFGEELDTPAYAGADRLAAVVLTLVRGG